MVASELLPSCRSATRTPKAASGPPREAMVNFHSHPCRSRALALLLCIWRRLVAFDISSEFGAEFVFDRFPVARKCGCGNPKIDDADPTRVRAFKLPLSQAESQKCVLGHRQHFEQQMPLGPPRAGGRRLAYRSFFNSASVIFRSQIPNRRVVKFLRDRRKFRVVA